MCVLLSCVAYQEKRVVSLHRAALMCNSPAVVGSSLQCREGQRALHDFL